MVTININDKPYSLKTDHGVFSYKKVDHGSRVLLSMIEETTVSSILDIGCGYGLLGIILGSRYKCPVVMVDVNDRACKLSAENAVANKVAAEVILADGLNTVTEKFDLIVMNPPIHAGKETVYRLFKEAHEHLSDLGSFYFVILEKHGARSAIREINNIYPIYRVIYKKSGLHVIKCQKSVDYQD